MLCDPGFEIKKKREDDTKNRMEKKMCRIHSLNQLVELGVDEYTKHTDFFYREDYTQQLQQKHFLRWVWWFFVIACVMLIVVAVLMTLPASRDSRWTSYLLLRV